MFCSRNSRFCWTYSSAIALTARAANSEGECDWSFALESATSLRPACDPVVRRLCLGRWRFIGIKERGQRRKTKASDLLLCCGSEKTSRRCTYAAGRGIQV